MKRRDTPYELDFVAEKCISCLLFEWSKLNGSQGLCWAEQCTRPPLLSDKEIKKRLALGWRLR